MHASARSPAPVPSADTSGVPRPVAGYQLEGGRVFLGKETRFVSSHLPINTADP
jgi:hypothetical protein